MRLWLEVSYTGSLIVQAGGVVMPYSGRHKSSITGSMRGALSDV